ncbi:hypothetical protein LEP1GSC082_3930 [Leptospira kirschneri str. H2]|nr:hypothetical protein LEP1GSC082_3930 [Leptospira kirschneri str. H2]
MVYPRRDKSFTSETKSIVLITLGIWNVPSADMFFKARVIRLTTSALREFVNTHAISRWPVILRYKCDNSGGSVLNSTFHFQIKFIRNYFQKTTQFVFYNLIDGFQSFCSFWFAKWSKNPSQNLKKNIFKRSGKFLKNVGVPTETVALAVFSRRLKL